MPLPQQIIEQIFPTILGHINEITGNDTNTTATATTTNNNSTRHASFDPGLFLHELSPYCPSPREYLLDGYELVTLNHELGALNQIQNPTNDDEVKKCEIEDRIEHLEEKRQAEARIGKTLFEGNPIDYTTDKGSIWTSFKNVMKNQPGGKNEMKNAAHFEADEFKQLVNTHSIDHRGDLDTLVRACLLTISSPLFV